MKKLFVLAALAALPACATSGEWSNADALTAKKIEMAMTAAGGIGEVEYHVSPETVPQTVRDAMDRLHPGGEFTGAERETNNGILYWELSREVDGMEVEAMFLPDGTPHSQEIQVKADAVPEAVQKAAAAAVDGGTVNVWEEIKDGQGTLLEYHVKMSKGDEAFKVIISTDGKHLGSLREIPAEIEVPVK